MGMIDRIDIKNTIGITLAFFSVSVNSNDGFLFAKLALSLHP